MKFSFQSVTHKDDGSMTEVAIDFATYGTKPSGDRSPSRGLGDVYKRQPLVSSTCVFSLCVVNSGSLLIMFMFRK